MKRLIRWLVIFGVLGVVYWASAGPIASYWKEKYRIRYREAEVSKGAVVAVVNSTGTIKPVQSVSIGSSVSGPILSIYVDFNDEVKKDQLLARVDPKIYEANVLRDKATVASAVAALATRNADVKHARARLQQAENDDVRARALYAENKTFISATEMDKYKFERLALEAMVAVAEASVEQAKAAVDQAKGALQQSEVNVAYTEIRSPVDGIVVNRKIDPGQTMAAQFQTPELFILAPDMRKEMHVFASVDEADIGLISDAQKMGQPVQFTVDAHPDELFEGKIFQIRLNSTTVQNVVTYPVVISVANPNLKLKPDMTANISFHVARADDALRVPNAALRFYPQREQVRVDDRHLLEGKATKTQENEQETEITPSADERAKRRRDRNRRHVWVVDGDFLKAVEVVTGLSDSSYTVITSEALREGQKVVTGIQTRE